MPLFSVPHWLLGPLARAREEQLLACAGLQLVWERVEGVTESSQPFRCPNVWWNHVLSEICLSNLTHGSWAFLQHQLPTAVSGTRLNGRALCGSDRCQALVDKSADVIMEQECEGCAEERKARSQVMSERQLQELSSAAFENVPCAAANNEMRYDINKQRAC